MSVGVNPPKTPVTKGSNGIATATLPNVCKMPGPPAPFVPAPLPNIGKSGDSPKGYTKKVKVEKKTVAVKGASFKSIGDMASKGTGGGLVSANTHGPCKFISPGSMDVKFEGKNVHLLADIMTNNGGGSGTPANSATMMGDIQDPETSATETEAEKKEPPKCSKCGQHHKNLGNLNEKGDKKPSELIKEGLGTFRKQKDVTSDDFDKTLCELAGQNDKSSKVVIKLTKQASDKIDKLKSSQRRGRH
ncbi:MAG: DUF4150 domain-containing protein [Gammaproteobacteria bacterium]|nr:DUF4150 domain-containing protein [Gammaproteobacteria bacterium]MDH5802374.1 DUF4150 domain-containing protein [Gammaproteobacteria bacterium]